MFSRHQLLSELPRLAGAPLPPLEQIQYTPDDFDTPSAEEEVWAFRGDKRDFASGLLFWVKSLQSEGWMEREEYFLPYAELGRCEPISSSDFCRTVSEYSSRLIRPLPRFLQEFAGLQSSQRMYDEWDDVAVVGELSDAFVAFHWTTTA
jgi:hypothetical protein